MISALSIDDDPAFQAFLKARLKPHGIRVITASDMAAAAPHLRERLAVILLDVTLPGFVGLEGLRELQSQLPDAPIVMVSGWEGQQLQADAIRTGAAGWLSKDAFTPERLDATVLTLKQLRRPEELPEDALSTEENSAVSRRPVNTAALTAGRPPLPPQEYGRALVVEDDPRIRAAVVSAIKSAGVDVLDTGTLAHALELLGHAHKGIRVVVLDLTLPDASGLTPIRQVSTGVPGVMLTVLTGDGSVSYREEGLAAGARRWFCKPAALAAVAASVREDLIYAHGAEDRDSRTAPSLEDVLARAAETGTELVESLDELPDQVAGLILEKVAERVAMAMAPALEAQHGKIAELLAPNQGDQWQEWLRSKLGEWVTPKLVDRLAGAVVGLVTALAGALLAWSQINGGQAP